MLAIFGVIEPLILSILFFGLKWTTAISVITSITISLILTKIIVDYYVKPSFRASFEQEVAALSQLHHPNLVHLVGVCQSDHKLMIVMNICDSSMEQVIKRKMEEGGWFSENEIVQWCIQLLEALKYLHSKHIAHRDLKVQIIHVCFSIEFTSVETFWFNSKEWIRLPQFIWLTLVSQKHVKRWIQKEPQQLEQLSSWHLKVKLHLTLNSLLTFQCLVIKRKHHMTLLLLTVLNSFNSLFTHCFFFLVWSFGVVLYQLMNGEPPERSILAAATGRPIIFPEQAIQRYPFLYSAAAEKCLQVDPTKRFTPSQLLNQFNSFK